MKKSAMIWTIGLSEFRIGQRLIRTWLVIAIAFLLAGVDFWDRTSLNSFASSYSASTGVLSPRYILASSSPTLLLILQIGIVVLAFDIHSRDAKARIADAFSARPFTNFELLSGRLLGVTLLMALPAVVLVLSLTLISYVLHWTQTPFGAPLEIYSVLSFLTLDLVPNLALWCAVTIFFGSLVRSGLLAAALTIAAAVAVFMFSKQLPPYLVPALAYATSSVISPSELAREIANGWVVTQRLVLVSATVGLLVLSALLYPRLDGGSRRTRVALAVSALLLATGVQCAAIMNTFATKNDFERIAAVHGAMATQPRPDIQHIEGTVTIVPGDRMELSYRISFAAPRSVGDELLFAFNPGFKIESLVLNDETVPYKFSDGLIHVSLSAAETDLIHELELVANGFPDTSFGYLDAALNEYNTTGVQGRSLALLGTQKAVFHDRYIALTPGIKWHPTAGPAYLEDDIERNPRDQFTVDLNVVVPNGWTVAGPGVRQELSDDESGKFRFAPHATLPEVGLFASRFVRRSTTVGDVEFELLLSPKHTRNIEFFADAMPALREHVQELIVRAHEIGLDYPYGMLSVVEVPSVLRVYGGGWRMDSIHALPGVLLIRETGFPTAKFDNRFDASQQANADEGEEAEILFRLLQAHFDNDVTGGNPYITVPRNLMNFQTYPTGSSATALSYLVDELVLRMARDSSGFYSIYFAGDRRQIESLFTITGSGFSLSMNFDMLASLYTRVRNQPMVWETVGNTALTDLDLRNQPRLSLEALLLKGDSLADMLLDTLGEDAVGELLRELRARYVGHAYTLSDFKQLANNLELDVEAVLGDGLNESQLPGFRMYSPSTLRLPDDSLGMPVYQSTFYLANEETVAGLVQVNYTERTGNAEESEPNEMPPVRIEADSWVQIALQSDKPIAEVRLQPYVSLNRGEVSLEIPEPESWEPEDHELRPFVTEVEWRPPEDGTIIIDDLDEGFTVTEQRESPPQYFQDLVWLGFAGGFVFPRAEYDQGLRTDIYARSQFMRMTSTRAWGRYRSTSAYVDGDDIGVDAHFKTRLPYADVWILEYHYPNPWTTIGGDNLTDEAFVEEAVDSSDLQEGFLIQVSTNESTALFEMEFPALEQGWNRVGKFELGSEDVVVSVKTNDRSQTWFVYADAIRWTPAR